MNWQPGECRSGDMIRVRLGSIWHYGIFVSETEVIQFGLPPVPAYAVPPADVRVCASDIDVFSCGNIVEVASFSAKENRARFSAPQIVARARARIGEGGYHLIHNNCEHFVNECVFGIHRSEQEEEARRRWRERPILDVYWMPIAENTRVTFASRERNRAIAACRSEDLAAAKRADWALLEIALQHSLGLEPDKIHFHCRRSGKWVCREAEFSLSHTEKYAVAAVSNRPCGVDAESLTTFDKKFSAALQDAVRRKALHPNEPEDMSTIELWSRKESAYKYLGKGRLFLPGRLDTTQMPLSTAVIKPAELIVSVCGESRAAIRFFSADARSVRLLGSDELEWRD